MPKRQKNNPYAYTIVREQKTIFIPMLPKKRKGSPFIHLPMGAQAARRAVKQKAKRVLPEP